MKKIAVVSKNRSILRFIELEAISCGVESELFSSPPRDLSKFFLVFLDLDSGQTWGAVSAENIVGISADRNEHRDLRVLRWPVDIDELRSLILNGRSKDALSKESFDISDERALCLDDDEKSVSLGGELYFLSEYEFRVFKALCEKAEVAVSREELNALLGAREGNISDVYICHLRRKLEKGGERRIIHTVRGKGYMTHYKVKK